MPRKSIRYLTVEAVKAIHQEVLAAHGGLPGLRDPVLLESAVAAPQTGYEAEPLMKDPIEIGAAYFFYLCRNHPFNDGNKRTALAACLVFLDANGRWPDPLAPSRNIDEWEALILDVAASRIGREAGTRRLKSLLRRKRRRGVRARRWYVVRCSWLVPKGGEASGRYSVCGRCELPPPALTGFQHRSPV